MSHEYFATLFFNTASKQIQDAEKILIEIKQMYDEVNKNASSIINSDIRSLLNDLLDEYNASMNNLSTTKNEIDSRNRSNVENGINNLIREIHSLYLKSNSIDAAMNRAIKTKNKTIDCSLLFHEQLSEIKDEKLRTMIRLLYRDEANRNKSFKEIKKVAEANLDPTKIYSGSGTEINKNVVEAISITGKVTDIPQTSGLSALDVVEKAYYAQLDESLRTSALNAIIKSISSKGFIIKKENIVRNGNIVKITAKKPGNQTAVFTVDLDGKFTYRFDGYEGHACEKDIASMEKDLEQIYGIKIKNKNCTWSNPDKITKKMEQLNNTQEGY